MSKSNSSNVGFFGLLTLVFITLKLTGYINWSWYYVLLPLYGPLVFIFLIIIGIYIAHPLTVAAIEYSINKFDRLYTKLDGYISNIKYVFKRTK